VTEERNPSYPYAYDRTATAGDLRERWGSLEPGGEATEEGVVRVAGRLRTLRTHGKVAFADLEDGTGRIQLFAQQDVLGEAGLEAFSQLSVGDIVGAEGALVATRRGELSIKVSRTELLAPCLRPMPEKWHGMTDVEARYRARHLDLIVNPGARGYMEARSLANATIRRYMSERGFIEAETPMLHTIAGGALARPFRTHHNALDIDLFLRIAPELHLKRLLIGGFERVYELNRSFRNEGTSTKHNPEYTMLEAYEAYVDYGHTMDLVEALVVEIAAALKGAAGEPGVKIAPPFRRMTMFEAIAETTGRDLEGLWNVGDEGALRSAAADLGVRLEPSWAAGKVVAEIYETRVEETLGEPTFIAGFPKEVSPLAKDHRRIPGFTEQADLVIGGIELAPIYSELNDPEEQRRRFETQARARAAGDQEAAPADEDFVEALNYGMPPAGGFGLGIDRLLMVLCGAASIREVIMWPVLRPEG
jgi:lysyl-tRNA synthetase, class II